MRVKLVYEWALAPWLPLLAAKHDLPRLLEQHIKQHGLVTGQWLTIELEHKGLTFQLVEDGQDQLLLDVRTVPLTLQPVADQEYPPYCSVQRVGQGERQLLQALAKLPQSKVCVDMAELEEWAAFDRELLTIWAQAVSQLLLSAEDCLLVLLHCEADAPVITRLELAGVKVLVLQQG